MSWPSKERCQSLCAEVQYLTKPREVFAEMQRVLKPGGMAMIVFSHRSFIEKAPNSARIYNIKQTLFNRPFYTFYKISTIYTDPNCVDFEISWRKQLQSRIRRCDFGLPSRMMARAMLMLCVQASGPLVKIRTQMGH